MQSKFLLVRDLLQITLLVLLVIFSIRQQKKSLQIQESTSNDYVQYNSDKNTKMTVDTWTNIVYPCPLYENGNLIKDNNKTRNSSYTNLKSTKESYGFFQYSEEKWERKKKIHRLQTLLQHGDQADSGWFFGYDRGAKFYQSNWEPTWSCGYEQRLGNVGDGGKWVCDPYMIAEVPECNVVCIGSNNDWGFEEAVYKMNPKCRIYTFDHTIKHNVKNKPEYVNYYAIGLGPQNSGDIRKMDVLLRTAGLLNTTIDILKIDCEGCEYGVYVDFFTVFIRQILIELHGVGPKNQRTGPAHVNTFFESMHNNGYVIFHKEPNTLGCRGNCIEYGFIKLNLTY